MPKATAAWLIEHTSITFEQIADFCGLHITEVQGIADGDVAQNIKPIDPVISSQLSAAEIERCERDKNLKLRLSDKAIKFAKLTTKSKSKYTPIARRQSKPDGIAWLIENCPELSVSQIVKLIGTTKVTVESIKDKTHWDIENIKSKDPIMLGLCTQKELDDLCEKARALEFKKGVKKSDINLDEPNQEYEINEI
ncbi:MAG: DUF1013 domain-containing protein [Proteobacteria bacterium]|nr:DUF1013 domain-containing protein [Pseudomonadota bacterium]